MQHPSRVRPRMRYHSRLVVPLNFCKWDRTVISYSLLNSKNPQPIAQHYDSAKDDKQKMINGSKILMVHTAICNRFCIQILLANNSKIW